MPLPDPVSHPRTRASSSVLLEVARRIAEAHGSSIAYHTALPFIDQDVGDDRRLRGSGPAAGRVILGLQFLEQFSTRGISQEGLQFFFALLKRFCWRHELGPLQGEIKRTDKIVR